MDHLIDELLRSGGGVILRRDHPANTGSLDWALRTGRLTPVLPGVYARPGSGEDWRTRVQAAVRLDPGAVVTGAVAAKLTYWPDVPVDTVSVASPSRRRPQPGFEFERRRIHPELVWHRGPLAVTAPSLTAIDLATWDDTDALDHAFRARVVTLASLRTALQLTAGRPGNGDRRRLLIDSRGEPWSAAERQGQRLLRTAGITGWKPNLPFRCPDGTRYYLDIAFRRQKLVVEIDGKIHQFDDTLFESDRLRQNQLMLHGWRVLRFTWDMIVNHPDEVLATIRAALARR